MGFKRAAGSMPMARASKKAKTSLAKLTKKVNSIAMQIEAKNKDYSLRESQSNPTTGNYSPAGNVILLNDILEGDGPDGRSGRKIMVKSLLMRQHLRTRESSAGNTPTLPTHRTIIIWDKIPSGVLPAVSEILDFSSVINGDEALAPLNMANSDRFVVLFDDTNGFRKPGVDSESNPTLSSGGNFIFRETTVNKFIPISQGVSIYKSASSTPQTGALYFVTVGNRWSSVLEGPDYVQNLTLRVKYTDA